MATVQVNKPVSKKQKENNLANIYNHLIGIHSDNPKEKERAQKACEKAKEKITAQKACLIPIFKIGDEKPLTSIFLSSLTLIDEFRFKIFKDIKLKNTGKIHVFTEIEFPDTNDDSIEKKIIPDGLILIEQKGKIVDSAFFEMKNGKDLLKKEQIEKYLTLADKYGIRKMVTVSNQYVSTPSDSPLKLPNKLPKDVSRFHLSWNLILTYAKILLHDNAINIKDQDQVNIMEEVVRYMLHSKSGVISFTKMKDGWSELTKRIKDKDIIKSSDKDVRETLQSWLQEEKDMALILSRKIGSLVEKRSSNKNETSLISENELETVLKIEGTASDIKVVVDFKRAQIEFSTFVSANKDKQTLKGRVGCIKDYMKKMEKNYAHQYEQIIECLVVNLQLYGKSPIKKCYKDLDEFVIANKTDKADKGLLNKFGFNLIIKPSYSDFAGGKKVITEIEKYLLLYYQVIVQNLVEWKAEPPQIDNSDHSTDI